MSDDYEPYRHAMQSLDRSTQLLSKVSMSFWSDKPEHKLTDSQRWNMLHSAINANVSAATDLQLYKKAVDNE